MSRVETGVVQFDEDWPGVFIRGDNAFGLMVHLKALEQFLMHNSEKLPASAAMGLTSLKDLIQMLDSCNMSNNPPKIQHIHRAEPEN